MSRGLGDVYKRQPLNEPVAWQGPIVMNTQQELETAFREFHEGSFIKQTDKD